MRGVQTIGSMTGASPVTTIHGSAWQSYAKGEYSSDRACPCHALDALFLPQSKLNSS